MINDAINAQVKAWDFWVRGRRMEVLRRNYFALPQLPDADADLVWGVEQEAITRAMSGDCYSVVQDIVELLLDSAASLPDWTLQPQDVPSRSGFVWADRSLWSGEIGKFPINVAGFMWSVLDNLPNMSPRESIPGLGIMLYVIEINPNVDAILPWPGGMWRFGEPYSLWIDQFTREGGELSAQAREVSKLFATFIAFISQTIVQIHPERAGRAERKRAGAAFNRDGTIKVISLRRIHRARADVDDPHTVEWSCRWIVRGHWRNQFYPAEGRHRPKWIHPYPKGPDDLPLRLPTTTLFEVNR